MSDKPLSLSIEATRALNQSMQNGQARLEVLTRNAANVQTPGYLRQIPFAKQLDEQAIPHNQQNPAVGAGSNVSTSANITSIPPNALGMSSVQVGTDFRPGPLRATGNPLDVALIGPVFVEVDAPTLNTTQASQGENTRHWVKGGQWQIDANGVLKTAQGHVILGTQGPIVLTTPNPSIDAQGRIFEQGKQVAQLQLWQSQDGKGLSEFAITPDGTFAIPESTLQPIANAHQQTPVRQGFIEASNVSSAVEMTELIRVMRQFEANQKILQMRDEMLDKTLNQLGQF